MKNVIIIIVILIIGSVGWVYLSSNQSSDSEVIGTEMLSFENADMGYSLKYSKTWTPETRPYDSPDLILNTEDGEVINVTTQSNDKNLSVKDWIEDSFPISYSDTFELETRGGNEVYRNDTGSHLKLNNNRILTITYTNRSGPGSSGGVNHVSEYEQILDSVVVK